MAHGGTSSTMLTGESLTPMQSELLCFVSDKCKRMAADDIVKIVMDFYDDEEVLAARKLIVDLCNTNHRMPNRKGSDRIKSTIEDIVGVLLNPEVTLPVFYAVNLTRLPPVDASHCDVSAILAEVSMLRQEVRAVTQLRDEVAQLRALMMVNVETPGVVVDSQPSLTMTTKKLTFVDHARRLKESGTMAAAKRPAPKPIVGSSTSNMKVKAVKTCRTVDLFISRLHPLATKAELVDCIESVNKECAEPVNIVSIECDKLNSRFADLYCSYRLQIRIDAADMQRALDLFMSPTTWPAGIFVKRFFQPRNGSTQATNN
jgi:hypothetical protein